MKTCPACHTDITDPTSRFCPNCGAPLHAADNPYATPSGSGTTGDDIGKTTPTGGFGRTGAGSTGSGFGTGSGSYTPPSSYNTGYTGYTYQPPVAQPSGGLAIAALICAFFVGIVGFILGIVGLNQYPKGSGYRTMCIVAIILPLVWLALVVLMVVITVLAGGSVAY